MINQHWVLQCRFQCSPAPGFLCKASKTSGSTTGATCCSNPPVWAVQTVTCSQHWAMAQKRVVKNCEKHPLGKIDPKKKKLCNKIFTKIKNPNLRQLRSPAALLPPGLPRSAGLRVQTRPGSFGSAQVTSGCRALLGLVLFWFLFVCGFFLWGLFDLSVIFFGLWMFLVVIVDWWSGLAVEFVYRCL